MKIDNNWKSGGDNTNLSNYIGVFNGGRNFDVLGGGAEERRFAVTVEMERASSDFVVFTGKRDKQEGTVNASKLRAISISSGCSGSNHKGDTMKLILCF